MDVFGVEHVVFRGNTFTQDDTLPDSGSEGVNGLKIEKCVRVEVEDVQNVPV